VVVLYRRESVMDKKTKKDIVAGLIDALSELVVSEQYLYQEVFEARERSAQFPIRQKAMEACAALKEYQRALEGAKS